MLEIRKHTPKGDALICVSAQIIEETKKFVWESGCNCSPEAQLAAQVAHGMNMSPIIEDGSWERMVVFMAHVYTNEKGLVFEDGTEKQSFFDWLKHVKGDQLLIYACFDQESVRSMIPAIEERGFQSAFQSMSTNTPLTKVL